MAPRTIPLFAVSLGPPERERVARVLRSGWLSQGPTVEAFERKAARALGARQAVAVSSGTAALHLALAALGVGPGDEVITTPLTFMATANAVLYTGARPVFADIDPATLNLDPESVQEALTPRTKVILPVHFAGVPADMKGLGEIARDRGLSVVEDAAHALGTVVRGRSAGTLGTLGCFSFYPTKTLTTGEGGLVTTREKRLDRRLRLLRNHGMSRSAYSRRTGYAWEYDVEVLGYNCRMNEVEAAIGLAQFGRLPSILARRRRCAALLRRGLSRMDLRLQRVEPGVQPACHFLPAVLGPGCPPRGEVLAGLVRNRIMASFHYRLVYRHRYFSRLRGRSPRCPEAEAAEERLVSLPCHQEMTRADALRVVRVLGKTLK